MTTGAIRLSAGPAAIQPAESLSAVMAYLRDVWTPEHPAGRDEAFARFMFQSPWVDQAIFPSGISVFTALQDGQIIGVAPFLMAPDHCWCCYLSVSPAVRGFGTGLGLIDHGRRVLPSFLALGVSPAARYLYSRLQFQHRLAQRWRLGSGLYEPASSPEPAPLDWITYRYRQHPSLRYEMRGETIVREDHNAWGSVLHVARLGQDWPEALAGCAEQYDLVQAWAYDTPGIGWTTPAEDVPSVFHPPACRGNALDVVGYPSVPVTIHGSDGGQDRPPCA